MTIAINPKKLNGPRGDGYVLDAHTVSSEFIGYNEFGHPMFDTQRTELDQAYTDSSTAPDLYQTGTTLAVAAEELRDNGHVAAVFA